MFSKCLLLVHLVKTFSRPARRIEKEYHLRTFNKVYTKTDSFPFRTSLASRKSSIWSGTPSIGHACPHSPTRRTRRYRYCNIDVVPNGELSTSQRYVVIQSFLAGARGAQVSHAVDGFARIGVHNSEREKRSPLACIEVYLFDETGEFFEGGVHPGVNFELYGRSIS